MGMAAGGTFARYGREAESQADREAACLQIDREVAKASHIAQRAPAQGFY